MESIRSLTGNERKTGIERFGRKKRGRGWDEELREEGESGTKMVGKDGENGRKRWRKR